jgi:hypothetical protein
MVIKQQAKSFILLMQEGKLITYLILRVGVRVTLVTLLAAEAKRHGEAAQSTQIIG